MNSDFDFMGACILKFFEMADADTVIKILNLNEEVIEDEKN